MIDKTDTMITRGDDTIRVARPWLNAGRMGVGVRTATPINWSEVQRVYDTGVNQWDLVERFGVSRTTIREAAKAGLLVLRPQPGRQTAEHNWLRQRFHAYRGSARKRHLDFELSLDEFKAFAKSECWYCGGGPVRVWRERQNASPVMFNGLDRLDSSKGYTADNVVGCCGWCNRSKNSLSPDEFLSLARRIAARHGTNAST